MQTSQPACGTDGCPSHIFVARQPIYDANHKIWGYELFFRPSGEATSADIQDPESATASVIVDGFSPGVRRGGAASQARHQSDALHGVAENLRRVAG